MKNRDVYIGFGLRTPIGIKGKQFKHYRPELLGAHLLNQIKKIESESNIDSIICGNTVGTGGNIGRLMTLFLIMNPIFQYKRLICSVLHQVLPCFWVI